MGKKTNSLFREKLNRIEQVSKEMEKERKKIIVECAHQNENGKLKIYPVNEHGEFECKYCKQRFNTDRIKGETLSKAIKTVHDALQQIRCYSDINEDQKIIRLLGELDFNIQETQELYERIVNVYGNGNGKKNKNKKKNRDNQYGGYSNGGNISFLGGGKR